jgi:hypothetical protein
MQNTKKKSHKFTIEKLTLSEIEPYLKLPTGKSYSEIKEQAKELSTKFSIPIEEVLKYFFSINGFPLIELSADAIPHIIKFSFNKNIDEFGLLKVNEELTGFCFTDSGGEWQYITYSLTTKDMLIIRLMKWLVDNEEHKLKAKNFLIVVKKCIKLIGNNFYSLPKNKNLDEVSKLIEINIDIEKLLYGGDGSGGDTVMRYVLASCYNELSTTRSLMNNALYMKVNYDDITMIDLSDEYERNDLSSYVSRYQNFGAMLYSLDKENKEIVKGLIDNYCGW